MATPKKNSKRKSQVESKPPADARKEILLTSLQLFAEKGFEGTTTREIAARSKLNISLISYYFGSKEGLYEAVFENFMADSMKEIKEVLLIVDKDNVTEAQFERFFREIVSRILRQRVENKALTVLIQREIAGRLAHSRAIHEKMCTQLGQQIINVFETAQKKGIVRRDLNLHGFMMSLMHVIDGYFMIYPCKTTWVKQAFDLEKNSQSFCDHVVKLFLYGSLK